MPFPDLVWAALGIIGGLLLIGDTSRLATKEKWGIGLIFVGFLFQVYWNILHQTETAVTWNSASQIQIIYVTLIVVIPLFVWPGFLRKWILVRNKPRGHK